MAKKRTWDANERKVCSKDCKVKQVATKEEKVAISKDALEDWRITRNELAKEVCECNSKIKDLECQLYTKQKFVKEQDEIISDMFDDLVDTRNELEWVKLERNISLIVNVILIIALVFCIC